MKLLPHDQLKEVTEITPEYLAERNIKGLLLDLDNTLIVHGDMGTRPELLPWFAKLNKAGVLLRFVSNGKPARIQHWVKQFHVPAVGVAPLGLLNSFAAKPLPTALRRAMKEMQLSPNQVAMVGDQLFTDVLSGNLACCFTILVQPLSDRSLPHTRLLRMLEELILKHKRR